MLTGTMTNGIVMLTTTGGVPIIESTAPDSTPAGYHAQMGFVDSGTQIVQTWTVLPDVGTVADAAATLAQMQAASLSDDDALKVPALFPEWEDNGHCYAQGDRVVYHGKLYKCIAAHTSSDTVAPAASPQRWAEVLPSTSTDTDVEEWQQGKSYTTGDKVKKYGAVYESLMDGNTIEPGTFGSESAWKQITQ